MNREQRLEIISEKLHELVPNYWGSLPLDDIAAVIERALRTATTAGKRQGSS